MSEKEDLQEFVAEVENPLDIQIDTEFEQAIFESLGSVDGLLEFLRDAMAKDMQRYFDAPDDDSRMRIKGAFQRTAYLRKRIIQTHQGKDLKKDLKKNRQKGVA